MFLEVACLQEEEATYNAIVKVRQLGAIVDLESIIVIGNNTMDTFRGVAVPRPVLTKAWAYSFKRRWKLSNRP